MRKNLWKRCLRIAVAALIAAFAFLLAACSDRAAVTVTELTGWQEYVITRPDTADSAIVASAVKLTKAVEEKTGIQLKLTTDWVKRGEEPPTGTKEILIGDTNRPESAHELLYHDYKVEFVNDRVVITGGSPDAIAKSVDWFIENCLTETVSVPSETYFYGADYPLRKVTVDGVLLTDFAVPASGEYASEYDTLRQWLAENTGVNPSDKGDHRIILHESGDLTITQMSMAIKDGDLMLEVGENGVAVEEVLDRLIAVIETRDSDAVTLEGKVELEMKQIATVTEAQIAEWRRLTDDRIAEILASPNPEIPMGTKVYYVSPNGNDQNDGLSPDTAWLTLEKVNQAALTSGSYVCFERGGLWRGQLSAKAGVTYTAYGEGDKPRIYASPLDGADASLWTEAAENIWVFSEAWKQDVGTLVFNHGEAHAIKCVIRTEADGSTFNNTTGEPFKTWADLTTDLHFYHDYSGTGKLYLYSEGNPGERYDSIEFNIKQNVVAVGGNSGVTIDNLCIKYGGAHGVGAGTVKNLTVQNCEFGWIGGSIQAEGIFGRNYGTRYGNAVEIYGGCDTYTVTDNYIYQIYDAGITQQVGLNSEPNNIKHQKNMTYARNVIEYCNYSIEYFLSGCVEENPSRMENFLIEDNLMWYAAEGFCEQRPDGNQGAHIKGWSGGGRNRATGYVVKNNLMCGSKDMLVQIMSDLYNPDGSDSMPTLSGNHFVGKLGGQFGTIAMEDQNRQNYDAKIVDYVSGKSDGTDTFWFE